MASARLPDGGDQGYAGPVGEVDVGGGVEEGEVGAGAGCEAADVVAAQGPGSPAVAAQRASSGVMPISRTAMAMQKGMELVKEEPGLQSVDRATVAPASRSRRASG